MSQRPSARRLHRDESESQSDRGTDSEPSLAPETVLELLEDEYAQAILESVAATAKPARDLAEELDSSRATVYRRLNRLEEAGLVETSTAIHPDGHHRQVYEATLANLTVTLGADGFQVEAVRTGD